MKILITGSNGFIGYYLSNYFLAKGWVVYGISRSLSKIIHNNFTWIHASIDQSTFHMPSIDFCIHTAALSPNLHSSTVDYINNNITGTKNVIDSIKNSKCKKIIFLSGVSVYGEIADKEVNEKTPIINPGPYGSSKYLAEREIIGQTHVEHIIFRLPGVLGRYANNPWLVRTIRKIISNINIEVYNKNELFNNAVDIHNLARFLYLCITDNKITNNTFILGAADPMYIYEIIDYIKYKTNSTSNITYCNKKKSFTINYVKAKEVGYKPYSLKKMISGQINDILRADT